MIIQIDKYGKERQKEIDNIEITYLDKCRKKNKKIF